MSRNVLVLAEIRDGGIRSVTFEALGAARLAAEGGTVNVALLGAGVSVHESALREQGADRIYKVEHEALRHYTPDAYTQAFAALLKETAPDCVFMGHTATGKDLAPRVAAKFGWGLISDVTDIALVDGELVFTRPIYAGKAFQKKKTTEAVVFATIRPNNIQVGKPDASRISETVDFKVEFTDLRSTVRHVVRQSLGRVDLAEAKIIVSGGRGVKSVDGFKPLEELADVLGAAVGASCGACDAGYCDYALQIGQTGKVVTPDLYIACGISGAIQHVAGMSNAKIIVAINKDPEAPIFKIADYGIVGDLFEIVPLLSNEFRSALITS
ncbi:MULTISPECIES: electron transfer flavoprotein subunit alpha/FixB family protein [unclassified Paenibacillus]|uniref:electron transfer flavoprotein subunit alpha/FixB family protein n=1 Tax=unclassified Paenibacillus TaxID=185978 RepID=UPI0006D13970|nr:MULTISPECIES: electron transfer flavoprotein subunit alpha/FixB family protein [unclassified Paenibacillus]